MCVCGCRRKPGYTPKSTNGGQNGGRDAQPLMVLQRAGQRPEACVALRKQRHDKYETRFYNCEQSALYKPSGMVIPKLPMYHPYHPFRNTIEDDDILQVPLAVILPNTDLVPQPLLKLIANTNTNNQSRSTLVAYTIPGSA